MESLGGPVDVAEMQEDEEDNEEVSSAAAHSGQEMEMVPEVADEIA